MIPNQHYKSITLWIILLLCTSAFPAPTHAASKFATSPTTSLTSGLVGYWTLDGKDINWNTNKTTDRSGNSNTGTLTNMSTTTSPVAGKIGQGLSFANSNYVAVSNNSSLQFSGAVPITLSVWVKPSKVTGYGTFLIKGRDSSPSSTNYAFRQDSTGKKLEFYFYNTGVANYNVWTTSSNVFPTSNIWYHVVVTYTFGTGGSMVAYVNGVSVAGTWTLWSGNDTADVDTQRLTIGEWVNGAGGEAFSGTIDDVRIYNRALSATDVAQLYKQGASKFATSPTTSLTSGLVGYWTLDGKDINWNTNKTTDRSGNGNTGTLKSMNQATSPVRGKIGQGLLLNNSAIYLPTFTQTGQTYTFAMWAKLNNNTGYLFDSITGRLVLNLGTNASLPNRMTWYDGAFHQVGSTDISTGVWHHLVWVLDSGSGLGYGYVDGVLQGSASYTGKNIGSTVCIGGWAQDTTCTSGFNANGIIDDFRVYNRALSASEITQLYKSGKVVYKVCPTNTVKDTDGNVYGTMAIGSQCWMKQNMRVGTRIAASSNQTNNSIIEKYCYSDTDANCTSNNPNQPDGGLYQWDEAMQYVTTAGARGICPAGWHIPTDGEQYTLENYLKDNGQTCNASRSASYDCDTAGTKLKPNGSSGFEGNLAGYASAGSFTNRGTFGYFWSSSESGASAFYRTLFSANSKVNRLASTKSYGFSVRCLKN